MNLSYPQATLNVLLSLAVLRSQSGNYKIVQNDTMRHSIVLLEGQLLLSLYVGTFVLPYTSPDQMLMVIYRTRVLMLTLTYTLFAQPNALTIFNVQVDY